MLTVENLKVLPLGFDALLAAAQAEGHGFITRLAEGFTSGDNRFAAPDEVFAAAWLDGALAGVGGLNRDPYADDPELGRLRHVYVHPAAPRHGVASALVGHLLAAARGRFRAVRLRTASAEASALYERFGFVASAEDRATHRIRL